MSVPEFSAWQLLTAKAGLLGFLIGLYTLIGRERKSPYQINSLLSVFAICAFGVIWDVLSLFMPPPVDRWIRYAGAGALLWASMLAFWKLNILRVRFTKYIDSAHPKHIGLWRWAKDIVRTWRGNRDYEHNPAALPKALEETIRETLAAERCDFVADNPELGLQSVAVVSDNQAAATNLLVKIALAFLQEKYPVQYMTVSRHPIEFVEALRSAAESLQEGRWNDYSRKFFVIDAYTKHFGFADSINSVETRRLKSEHNVTCVTSSTSYAGLHWASSRAFNKIKSAEGGSVRQPTLIIYEDCFALADLESPDQYRIFIRHVLPSERLWGGMFTVFAETALPDYERRLLRSYAGVTVDLTSDRAGEKEGQ